MVGAVAENPGNSRPDGPFRLAQIVALHRPDSAGIRYVFHPASGRRYSVRGRVWALRSGFDIQLISGMAGKTQPIPAMA